MNALIAASIPVTAGILPAVSASFALIVLTSGSLRPGLRRRLAGLFDHRDRDYRRTLRETGRMIVSVLDLDEIAARIMDTVGGSLGVESLAVFNRRVRREGFVCFAARGPSAPTLQELQIAADTPLVRYLEQTGRTVFRRPQRHFSMPPNSAELMADLDTLLSDLVLPMRYKTNLNGFIVCGTKTTGRTYRRGEVELLETLAGQSAMAVENARAYRVIAELNRGLEDRVAERTRQLEAALEEKERTMDRLVRTESLAAIGQLVAGTAHELNNPLTSVTSLLQSVREDLAGWDPDHPPESDLLEDMAFADRELRRARKIVSSLLDLSRQTDDYREAVDLNAVVDDAVRVLYNTVKDLPLRVEMQLSPDLPPVAGNFAELGQLVMNLMKNAAQALGQASGVLQLSTHHDTGNGVVILACTDDGPGVPESLRADVFKPFFTTKPVGQGTGLGLYICHQIAVRHSGSLSLENPVGGGARFVLRIPDGRGTNGA